MPGERPRARGRAGARGTSASGLYLTFHFRVGGKRSLHKHKTSYHYHYHREPQVEPVWRLETFGLVHEHESGDIFLSKIGWIWKLKVRSNRACLCLCWLLLGGSIGRLPRHLPRRRRRHGALPKTGIPGEVADLEKDVPWVLTGTFRIGRRPARSTTGTARPC